MNLTEFVYRLKKNKAKGFLVGGAVRDKMLGIEPKDNDYCVVGLLQQEFEEIFPDAELQGADFPVYRIEIDGEMCEVALARTERKMGRGHRGFDIESHPDVTIEEDLSRRDLTINAMAINLHNGLLIDPFNGQEDIINGIIRMTTEAFKEDPLRVYRAARFAARYDFIIEHHTLDAMNLLKGEMTSLSYERIIEETKKALSTDHPSMYFKALKEAGVLDIHFSEFNDLLDFDKAMKIVDTTRYFSKELFAFKDDETHLYKDQQQMTAMASLLKRLKNRRIAEDVLNRFNLQKWKLPILGFIDLNSQIEIENASVFVDLVEGYFEPRDLRETEKMEVKEYMNQLYKKNKSTDGQKKDLIIDIEFVKVFEKRAGIKDTIGINGYLTLVLAESVESIKDKTILPELLSIVFSVLENGKKDLELSRTLIEALEKNKGFGELKGKIQKILKFKNHLEAYILASESLKFDFDVKILQKSYQPYFVLVKTNNHMKITDAKGIETGFKIHSLKKIARVHLAEKIKRGESHS